MSKPAIRMNIGDRSGRLTVTAVPETVGRYLKVAVICDCGKAFVGDHNSIRKGTTKSCGCYNAEVLSLRSTTHGLSKSPIYAVWNAMIQRTTNKDSVQWADYGGRGISVCEAWKTFDGFYADMGDPPFPKASIDRIDNDKSYAKANCRWATRAEQNNNKRNTVKYSFRGELLTIRAIAEILGVPVATLVSRIYIYGWSEERAFSVVDGNANRAPRKSKQPSPTLSTDKPLWPKE